VGYILASNGAAGAADTEYIDSETEDATSATEEADNPRVVPEAAPGGGERDTGAAAGGKSGENGGDKAEGATAAAPADETSMVCIMLQACARAPRHTNACSHRF